MTVTRPANFRPPSKEEINDFLAAFDETTPNSAHWTHEDMTLMVRAYRYQAEVAKGLQEDLRDAGREMREMAQESAGWQSRYEESTGGGW